MKKNRIKSIVFILLLFIIGFNCCEKDHPGTEPNDNENFQEILNTELRSFQGIGVSAAVYYQNQDYWSGTSGISFKHQSVTEDMVFCIGSITKTFIAALCLQLAEEGFINLEDYMYKWIPEFPKIDSTITVRHLLNNTSGLYNISDNPELWNAVFQDPDKVWTLEEFITPYLLEPYAAPGEGWYYSNTNYILLGEVIRRATGAEVSFLLRNRLFDPLGLNHTHFAGEEKLPPCTAHGWFNLSGEGTAEDISLISEKGIYSVLWTSAAIFSTPKDLAKWSLALFTGNVLSSSALKEMLNPICTLPGTDEVSCGMGVFIIGPGNNTGMELTGYTGRTFGYLSSTFYVPEQGISVAVNINQDNKALLDAVTTNLIKEAIRYKTN